MVEADSGWVAVWFTAPVVETYHRADGAPSSLAALGPDLCRPDVDIEAAVERMAALTGPDDEIKPVLLDQRVAAGMGNVYTSEVLFACGVDPFAKVVTMDEATPRTARAGRQAAAGQPRQRTANNGCRTGGRRGLRPVRPAVPPVRHAGPDAPPGRAGAQHLLVPAVPTRSAGRERDVTQPAANVDKIWPLERRLILVNIRMGDGS